MESTRELLMGLGMLTGIVTIVFIVAKYTYMIKKAMLDKGMPPKPKNTGLKYLDIGSIAVGLGTGLMVSSVFTTMGLSEDTTDLLVWGTILIFGSIGLFAAHLIRRKFGS